MNFEEMKIENGLCTIFDDDAHVTVQMPLVDVQQIIDFFDPVLKDIDTDSYLGKDTIKSFVLENGDDLELDLEFDEDQDNIVIIYIDGRITPKGESQSSYCHDFEIHGIYTKDWNEIASFVRMIHK